MKKESLLFGGMREREFDLNKETGNGNIHKLSLHDEKINFNQFLKQKEKEKRKTLKRFRKTGEVLALDFSST